MSIVEDSKPIHGFYYGSVRGPLKKLPAPGAVLQYFRSRIIPTLKEISTEDYWRKYGKGMATHAPQGYLAWEGGSVWVLNDGELKIVEFTDQKIRACTLPCISTIDQDIEDDPEDELCQIPWNWLLEESCKGEKLSASEQNQVSRNIDWTNDLHDELNDKIPFESL